MGEKNALNLPSFVLLDPAIWSQNATLVLPPLMSVNSWCYVTNVGIYGLMLVVVPGEDEEASVEMEMKKEEEEASVSGDWVFEGLKQG